MQIPLQLVCGCKGTLKNNPFPENARTVQILTAQKRITLSSCVICFNLALTTYFRFTFSA